MARFTHIWFVIASTLLQVKYVKPDSEDVGKDSPVHLRMMRSDLEKHFGVSSHDKVPEYEITHPFQVDEDGSFVSHVLYPHARQKRGLNEPNVWYYNVRAFGISLHLNLSKNEELMAPGMTVEKHENGTIVQKDAPKNTFYHGHVTSQAGSLVALSNANGLTGMVRVLDQILFLQPLDRQFVADEPSQGHAHLVYKRSIDQELREDYLQHSGESKQLFEDAESTRPRMLRKKPKRKRHDDGKYLEMALVADSYVIALHKKETETLLLMLANLLNVIFQDETIGEKKITIVVVQIKLMTTGLDYKDLSNHGKLNTLNNWASSAEANIPESDSHPLHPDVIALFSRGGIGGLASLGSTCKSRSSFVYNDMGLQSVAIMAHEAAHTLGVGHDESKECPNHQYIMSTAVPGGRNALTWSACSRHTIENFLKSKSSACLDDKPKKSINYMKYFNSKIFPGVQVNGDKQCNLMYGELYSQCKRTVSNCGSLYCTPDGASCLSKLAPPLDGTNCGVRHHCVKGECVDEGSEIIHGGWGKWSSYTKCSRTCGGGLQWRTRTCTKPRPQNGGDDCEGESKGFPNICNIKPCPPNGFDYRTHQCKPFGQDLVVFYRSNAPCELFCRRGYTYSPKGRVADGTKCYHNSMKKDICLGGKCLMVGCDYVIGSKASEDRCGKCNGDSTKCVMINTTYTGKWQNVGVDQPGPMFTAPKGSRRISVYNNANSNTRFNAIGVRDANNNYLIKLPSRTTKIQAAGSIIYYVKKRGKNEYVYIPGPINMSLKFVYVNLTSKPKFMNKGIKYKFLKPGKSAISSDEVEWNIQTDWTECSETCAGGKKWRIVRCRRNDDKSIVADNICGNGPNKPLAELDCNTQPCPKQWHLTDWTSCSKTCGPGFRTREVSCREKVANPATYNVVSGCKEPKPTVLKKKCIKGVCPAEWVPSEWSQCSKTCGGEGLATRNLTCKRLGIKGQFTVVPSALCKGAVKPPTSQMCNEDLPCAARKRSYQSLGCFRERKLEPLLPHLVKSLRPDIEWNAIQKIVDKCYELVKNSKYKVFGVKFYGECWVGPTPAVQFKTNEENCFRSSVGKEDSYYVYSI